MRRGVTFTAVLVIVQETMYFPRVKTVIESRRNLRERGLSRRIRERLERPNNYTWYILYDRIYRDECTNFYLYNSADKLRTQRLVTNVLWCHSSWILHLITCRIQTRIIVGFASIRVSAFKICIIRGSPTRDIFVNKNARLFSDFFFLEQLQNSQHCEIYSLRMLVSRATTIVICATESHRDARSTACTKGNPTRDRVERDEIAALTFSQFDVSVTYLFSRKAREKERVS